MNTKCVKNIEKILNIIRSSQFGSSIYFTGNQLRVKILSNGHSVPKDLQRKIKAISYVQSVEVI